MKPTQEQLGDIAAKWASKFCEVFRKPESRSMDIAAADNAGLIDPRSYVESAVNEAIALERQALDEPLLRERFKCLAYQVQSLIEDCKLTDRYGVLLDEAKAAYDEQQQWFNAQIGSVESAPKKYPSPSGELAAANAKLAEVRLELAALKEKHGDAGCVRVGDLYTVIANRCYPAKKHGEKYLIDIHDLYRWIEENKV